MIVYIKKEFSNDELLWKKPYKVFSICERNWILNNQQITRHYLIENELGLRMGYFVHNFYTEQEFKSIERDSKLNKLL